jgi:hypothetical protein
LDLDEQQLIEPSISNDLLELPRAIDIADLPDGIFDRPSGSESRYFANNDLEDFTRPPAVVTSSRSPANTDNDFSRNDVSHKPDYSRPDLVSSSSIHPPGVIPLSHSNEISALPTTPSVLPANINYDFARPEHVSQKRSRSTDEIWADALSEPEPAGDSPPADDAGMLQADAAKRRRMHLALLARSAGFAARAGSQKTSSARPNSDSKKQKRRSNAETATLLADDIQGIEYADTVYPTREGICVQRVYLMDNSKKRVFVVAASEALKDPYFKAAMDKEIAAFRENDCIEKLRLADLEDNVNAGSTRWVFTVKKGMTETRFKARLVARGHDDSEKELYLE